MGNGYLGLTSWARRGSCVGGGAVETRLDGGNSGRGGGGDKQAIIWRKVRKSARAAAGYTYIGSNMSLQDASMETDRASTYARWV